MTEKLYEQDSMLKSCLATVLSCAEDKGGYFFRRAAVS